MIRINNRARTWRHLTSGWDWIVGSRVIRRIDIAEMANVRISIVVVGVGSNIAEIRINWIRAIPWTRISRLYW